MGLFDRQILALLMNCKFKGSPAGLQIAVSTPKPPEKGISTISHHFSNMHMRAKI
jgi:hypothetical protein